MTDRVANTIFLGADEYDAMCKERLKLLRQVSTLKKKASVAHDETVAACARASDAKHRAKSAENGLRGLQQREDRMRDILHRIDNVLATTSADYLPITNEERDILISDIAEVLAL